MPGSTAGGTPAATGGDLCVSGHTFGDLQIDNGKLRIANCRARIAKSPPLLIVPRGRVGVAVRFDRGPGVLQSTLLVHPIAFQAGPFTVTWYGVMVALAFLAGLWTASRRGVREGF